MQLDSGGIAKGYAADEALAALTSLGIKSALVALSGDIAIGSPPPGRSGWRIRVQDETLTLANAAVSTSGDQFQFVQIDGVRYSHILDPRTGRPLQSAPTVSVIALNGIDADSMATALSVAGLSVVKSLKLSSIRRQSGGLLIDLRPLSTLVHGRATDHARVRCASAMRPARILHGLQ
jgi:thiamine biosynthesis lipoprotein ApbE